MTWKINRFNILIFIYKKVSYKLNINYKYKCRPDCTEFTGTHKLISGLLFTSSLLFILLCICLFLHTNQNVPSLL